jgi:hypothetical protein
MVTLIFLGDLLASAVAAHHRERHTDETEGEQGGAGERDRERPVCSSSHGSGHRVQRAASPATHIRAAQLWRLHAVQAERGRRLPTAHTRRRTGLGAATGWWRARRT